jgi:FHS family Na+ dependent glucose MFS transporter 1
MIAICLFVTAVSTAFIPSASLLEFLFFLGSTQGVAMGMLDTVANVLIIHMWNEKAGPWMQGLHCSFALGAVSAPLTVRLSQSLSSSGEDISSAFYFFSAFCFLCAVYFCFVPTPEPRFVDDTAAAVKVVIQSRDSQFFCRCCSSHTTIIVTTGCLLGLYVGCETSFGGFILLYSQNQYGMTEADGQFLNSIFWGALLIGRFVGILLANIVSVTKQLAADLVLAAFGCVILIVGLNIGGDGDVNNTMKNGTAGELGTAVTAQAELVGQTFLWIASGMCGLGLGTIFPCLVLQAEEFTDLSGRAASVLMVGAAIGEMIIPLVIGLWTASYSPGFVIGFTVSVCAVVVLTIFLIIQGRAHLNRNAAGEVGREHTSAAKIGVVEVETVANF